VVRLAIEEAWWFMCRVERARRSSLRIFNSRLMINSQSMRYHAGLLTSNLSWRYFVY